jgi:MFS family permease
LNAAPAQQAYPRTLRGPVWALALGQMLAWAIYFYVYPSLLPAVQKHTGWSMTQLTVGPAIALVVAGLISPLVGRWIDRGLGRRVLLAGPVIGSLGLVAWACVGLGLGSSAGAGPGIGPGSIVWYWATAALLGVATAMALYDPVFMTVTRSVPVGYARAIVVITLAGGLASTVAFPFTAWTLPMWGWRGTLWALAAIGLFVVVPINAWATSRLADATGAGVETAATPSPAQATPVSAPAHDAASPNLWANPVFWCVVAGFSGYLFVVAGLWQHLLVIGEARAIAQRDMLTIIMLIGPAQVAARVLQMLFAHRLGENRFAMLVFMGLPLCMALLVFGGNSFALLATFAILFGMGNGAVTLVRGTAAAHFFGRDKVAATHGQITLPAMLAKAAGPFVCAAWVVALSGIQPMLSVLLAISVATTCAYFLAVTLHLRARPAQPASAA